MWYVETSDNGAISLNHETLIWSDEKPTDHYAPSGASYSYSPAIAGKRVNGVWVIDPTAKTGLERPDQD